MKAIRFVPLVVLLPLLLATAAALTVWMIATVWATFNPSADIEIGSHDGSNESSVNASITSFYEIPAGDVNFDALATYTPPEWLVAAGEDIPGATVGVLETHQTLGLVFTVCNMPLGVNIDFNNVTGETHGMLNASTDTSDTFTSTGNIGSGPNAMTNRWNGYDIMPIGRMRAVDQYPSFLNDLYPNAEPRARYFGVSYYAPFATWAVVQLLIFEPGANIGPGIPNDPDWGYGSVMVLNNPTLIDPNSSAGDWCTPFDSQYTIFGETEDDDALRTNPQYGGIYTFRTWSRGQPDADGDGFENALDPCPFDPDLPSEDPRVTRGPDAGGGDSIMSTCDPGPTVSCWPGAPGLNDNCDNDKFANVADNCPLVANNEQETGGDADFDDIGDACDTRGNGPSVVDGDRPEVTIETPVEIIGPSRPPVGGIAELPDVPGSAAANHVALVGAAAAGLAALTAGAWYAGRRRSRWW